MWLLIRRPPHQSHICNQQSNKVDWPSKVSAERSGLRSYETHHYRTWHPMAILLKRINRKNGASHNGDSSLLPLSLCCHFLVVLLYPSLSSTIFKMGRENYDIKGKLSTQPCVQLLFKLSLWVDLSRNKDLPPRSVDIAKYFVNGLPPFTFKLLV